MYKNSIEAMPQEIKEEIAKTAYGYGILIDDIVSLEEKKSSKFDYKEICNCIAPCFYPGFWVVALKSEVDDENETVCVVFETTLTEHQEKMFLESISSCSFKDEINPKSLSYKYGIY